jgi:predicted DCC family thiol-disulfide oxidoreductase YuxK
MNIIFYDGLCPLCNQWVRWIIKHDQKQLFYFAPLQGETANHQLRERYPAYTHQDTVVYLDDQQVYLRSDAILEILRTMNTRMWVVRLGYGVPKAIRDFIYRRISKARYLYGKRYATCPVPPVAWRDRFLP